MPEINGSITPRFSIENPPTDEQVLDFAQKFEINVADPDALDRVRRVMVGDMPDSQLNTGSSDDPYVGGYGFPEMKDIPNMGDAGGWS